MKQTRFAFGKVDGPSGRAKCGECGKRIEKTDAAVYLYHFYSHDRVYFHLACAAKMLFPAANDMRFCLRWVADLFDKRPEDAYDEEGFPTQELNDLMANVRNVLGKIEGGAS